MGGSFAADANKVKANFACMSKSINSYLRSSVLGRLCSCFMKDAVTQAEPSKCTPASAAQEFVESLNLAIWASKEKASDAAASVAQVWRSCAYATAARICVTRIGGMRCACAFPAESRFAYNLPQLVR